MITKIYRFIFAGLVSCGIAAAFTACSDTWDDHYEGTTGLGDSAHDGTLWDAINKNPELSNFGKVLKATEYDKSLASSQVFTVFAPTNACFSEAEANKLIDEYNAQKGRVNREDNTVVKEFIQNHIALYTHSVSSLSNDTIVLMNGKYAMLTPGKISNSDFVQKNQLYNNGILYTVSSKVAYSPSVFDYFRMDPDLDSVRSFLYNPLFYYKRFQAANSVEGGLDDLGRTVYLDSVFVQLNELYSEIGRIADEDSTYWMVAPTNEVWRQLIEEYTPYFNYDDKVDNLLTEGDRDSLCYTNPRLAILSGTVFSATVNPTFLNRRKTTSTRTDSIYSTNAPLYYTWRMDMWGTDFNYYQYFDPLGERGVLAEPDSAICSNGVVLKSHDWKIDKLQTFARWIVVEGESSANIKEIGKTANSKGDSIPLASYAIRSVVNNNFRGKVWNSRFMEFSPETTLMYDVTYNITGVLSNFGYDIYLVTSTPLANDSNAVEAQRLPTALRCTLNYHNQAGQTESSEPTNVTTSGTGVDYLLIAEDFKFPCATFGLRESEPSVTLKIENRVTNGQLNRGTHTKTTCIDCILLVPHGTLALIDDMQEIGAPYDGPGVLMMPHGDNLWQYIMRR